MERSLRAWRGLFGAVLSMLVVSNAAAQDTRSLKTPRLVEKKPVSVTKGKLQCATDDVSVSEPVVRRDASCYIDAARAVELAKDPGTVSIDTRGKDDYVRLHPPEAINLPMSEIKTKAYLSSRMLLIYGSGRTDPSLEETCASLKGQGFRNARIVEGGVLSWTKKAGDLLTSQDFDIRALSELSAEELFAEVHSSDAAIVNLSRRFRSADIEPKQIVLEGPLTTENLISALHKRSAGVTKPNVRRVVLVGVQNINPVDLNAVLSSTKIDWPVFYYAGDTARYESSVKTLNALWLKKDKGPSMRKCGIS